MLRLSRSLLLARSRHCGRRSQGRLLTLYGHQFQREQTPAPLGARGVSALRESLGCGIRRAIKFRRYGAATRDFLEETGWRLISARFSESAARRTNRLGKSGPKCLLRFHFSGRQTVLERPSEMSALPPKADIRPGAQNVR